MLEKDQKCVQFGSQFAKSDGQTPTLVWIKKSNPTFHWYSFFFTFWIIIFKHWFKKRQRKKSSDPRCYKNLVYRTGPGRRSLIRFCGSEVAHTCHMTIIIIMPVRTKYYGLIRSTLYVYNPSSPNSNKCSDWRFSNRLFLPLQCERKRRNEGLCVHRCVNRFGKHTISFVCQGLQHCTAAFCS